MSLVKVLRVVLEYGMLLWLLYFTVRVARAIFKDFGSELREEKSESSGEARVTIVEAKGDEALLGRSFAFEGELTLGRGADNDIVIEESFVSHHHAVIFERGSQYVLEDLGSRNHTYLNGEELAGKAYLKPGDLVTIGLVTLKFER